MKNISLFAAIALMVVTLLLIAFTPSKKTKASAPAPKVSTADSKSDIEQAKRNSIMWRFLS